MTQAHFNFEHELRPPDDFSSLEESQDVLQQKIPSSSFTTDVPQLEVSSVSPPLSLTQDVLQQEEVSPEIPSPSLTPDLPQLEEVSPVSPSHSLTPEDETIPDHSFETKIIKGKFCSMKGKTREIVSLIIGNHIFRKRNSLKNGTIRFSCNGCEKLKPIKHLYAVASL